MPRTHRLIGPFALAMSSVAAVALVPQVEAVLREMKDSGEIEQLRAKLVTQTLEKAGEPRG